MFQWTKITPATASIPLPPRRGEPTPKPPAVKPQPQDPPKDK
jgi:hypothetical protein